MLLEDNRHEKVGNCFV